MAVNYVAKYTLKFNNLAGKGLLRVSNLASSMGRALTKGAAVGAVALAGLGVAALAMTHKYAAAADEMGKFSKQTGFTISTIEGLDFAMGQAGGSTEGMRKSLQKMSKGMGELKVGTGALFTLLNKSDKAFLKQLQGVEDNDEALSLLMKKMSQLTSVQDRAALSQAVWGRQGKDFMVIAAGGADALAKFQAEAERIKPPLTEEQVRQAEDYNDSLARVKRAFQGYVEIIATAVIPKMTLLSEKFKEFLVNNREIFKLKVTEWFNKLMVVLKKIDFKDLANRAKLFVTNMRDLAVATKDLIAKHGGLKKIGKAFLVLMGFLAFAKVATGIMAVSSALKGLAVGVKVVSIALTANPIGIAVMAIAAAVIVSVILIRQHWDTIGPIVRRVGAWFKGLFNSAKPIFAKLSGVVVGFFGRVMSAVKDMIAFVKPLWDAYWRFAGKVVAFNVALIGKAFAILKNLFIGGAKIAGKFASVVGDVWDGIGSGLKSMVDSVRQQINKLMGFLTSAKDKVAGVKDNILAALGNKKAQARIDARADAARKPTGTPASLTAQGIPNFVMAPADPANNNQAPIELTVVNEADGGTKVSKRQGSNTTATNLPVQPTNLVMF